MPQVKKKKKIHKYRREGAANLKIKRYSAFNRRSWRTPNWTIAQPTLLNKIMVRPLARMAVKLVKTGVASSWICS